MTGIFDPYVRAMAAAAFRREYAKNLRLAASQARASNSAPSSPALARAAEDVALRFEAHADKVEGGPHWLADRLWVAANNLAWGLFCAGIRP